MTAVNDIIEKGKPIPDDVTGVDDSTDGNTAWNRNGNSDGWDCPGTMLRNEPGAWLSATYGPLTVTAVREQPAEPEPDEDLRAVADQHCGAEDTHAGHRWRNNDRPVPHWRWCPGFVGRAGVPAEPEPDVLDLVRQYGDASYQTGIAEMHGNDAKTEARDATARKLLARIEAEVQRLRAAAQPPLADIIAAKAAEVKPILLEMRPVVLSLPQVPEGAVALVGEKTGTRYTPYGHPGLWRWEGDSPWDLPAVLRREGSVTVVMREPRTWPALPGDPEGVKAVRGQSGRIYRPTRGFWVWREGDDEVSCDSFTSLQNYDGPLVEVFDDKDGTR